jgi:hypothetical protein
MRVGGGTNQSPIHFIVSTVAAVGVGVADIFVIIRNRELQPPCRCRLEARVKVGDVRKATIPGSAE